MQEITSAAAWRGDVLSKTDSWIYMLNDRQIAELETLGARFVEDDPDLRFVQKEEYPLVECAEAIKAWGRDVDTGRGFVLVRGLRTHLYSDALSAAIYYILGLNMGDPIRQNEKGDLIDSIYATSDKMMDDPTREILQGPRLARVSLGFVRPRVAHVPAPRPIGRRVLPRLGRGDLQRNSAPPARSGPASVRTLSLGLATAG